MTNNPYFGDKDNAKIGLGMKDVLRHGYIGTAGRDKNSQLIHPQHYQSI